MTNNDNNNERENEMTIENMNDNQEITNEDLESAAELYDSLDFELDSGLDALAEETRLADAEWDEHWEAMDMDMLDINGELHDYDYDN